MRTFLIPIVLLCAAGTQASPLVITSGTYFGAVGDQAYSSWRISLTAPNGSITGGRQPGTIGTNVLPPICNSTAPCTFSFSGTVNSSDPSSTFATIDGVSYSNQIVSFVLTFVGLPQTVTPQCHAGAVCGGQGPPSISASWSSSFTMTGTVTVLSMLDRHVILTESISGSGVATANSQYAGLDPSSGAWTTFTFTTPEPNAAALAGMGGLLLLAFAAKRRQ